MDIKYEADAKVCELCSELCENYTEVDDYVREMLRVLRLNADLYVQEKHLLCNKCVEDIQRYFNFKSSCVDLECYINSSISEEHSTKLDLFEVYIRLSDSKKFVDETITKEYTVCRVCMKLVSRSSSISLSSESKDATLLNILLSKYVPELDINIAFDPVICVTCRELLQDYFGFMKKYSDIEDTEHREVEEMNSEGKIELTDVSQVVQENRLDTEKNYFTPSKTNIESDDCGGEKVKEEYYENTEMGIKHEEINIKSDEELDSVQQGVVDQTHAAASQAFEVTYRCLMCSYESPHDQELKQHVRIHRTAKFRRVHRCITCSYESSRKSVILRHLNNHGATQAAKLYPCDICNYKAKSKMWLKNHKLVHNDELKGTIFRCGRCDFETRLKSFLSKHELAHSLTVVTTYKCTLCPFETKFMSAFKQHELSHETPGAVLQTFTCEICNYETMYKNNLNRHMMIHKGHSEVTWYKCEACVYTTMYKQALNRHVNRAHGGDN